MEPRLSRRSLLALPLVAPLARTAARAQGEPTPAPAPADVPMYRGNPARTGEQPGPGPAGQPVFHWQVQIGRFFSSSPSVAGGLVYIGSVSTATVAGGALHAVDAVTGIERWRLATAPGDGILATPTVVGGIVVVGSYDGILVAADAATGIERWRFQAETIIYATPAIVDGVVHIGDGAGNLYALDVEDGSELWRFTSGRGFERAINSPAIADGVLYCVDGSLRAFDTSILRAFEASTGVERWSYTPGDGSILRGVAVVSGDRVYVPTTGTTFHVVDRGTGDLLMQVDVGTTSESELAVAGGVAYLGTDDGMLHAVDVATGEPQWTTSLNAGVPMVSDPAVADGRIYIGDELGIMHAVDIATGEEVWNGGVVSLRSSPAVTGGMLYVGGFDGVLRAVGGEGDQAPAG